MSDRSALAVREETGDRELETAAPEEQEVAEVAEGLEQKDAKEAMEESTRETVVGAVEPGVVPEQDDATVRLASPALDALTPALSQGEREQTAERIRQSEALPVGLRTRLAELVLASDSAAAEQAIRAVEASLPGALRIGAGEIARPAHPGGDVFFRGDPDAVSDEAAEALARGQLSRSGMLRGQRARVAE